MNDHGQGARACGAKTRGGTACKNPPIPGGTRCRKHGGASPQAQAAAQRRLERRAAEAAVARHALPRDVDPLEALAEEVRRCAGTVEWLRARVEELQPQALVWGVESVRVRNTPEGVERTRIERAGVHPWLQLYNEERDRLRRVCADSIAAGVAERQVRLAEQQGALLADGLSWLLRELGHDGDEHAMAAVARMLTAVERGAVPGREGEGRDR